MSATKKQRLVVGISGATGILYGVRLLQDLRTLGIESHLVVSKSGELTRGLETDLSARDLAGLADVTYRVNDVGAAIASGSFLTLGMVVAPCSIRTLSEIATGVTSTLLSRAADVTLKERRRLVLLVRETPLHAGHLRSMLAVSELGGTIMPPMPAFYPQPRTIDNLVAHGVARVLDQFGLEAPGYKRWGEAATVADASIVDAASASQVVRIHAAENS